MKPIVLDYSRVYPYITEEEIQQSIKKNSQLLQAVKNAGKEDSDVLGWLDVVHCMGEELLNLIEAKAEEVRKNADVLLVIGVGGSNQGTRAVIKALGDASDRNNAPQVLYAGNNLSPQYLSSIISKIKGKSVYVNVIAKNFATLEPGITFRIIRKFMEESYGAEGAAERIIATASLNNSSLELLSKSKGYTLLPFPLDVGGRFSILTAVGLFPIECAGLDIRELLAGARDMEILVKTTEEENNPAVLYAIIRNLLLSKGFSIEILAHFEPLFTYFTKWWVQLYGESEGKEGKGIFTSACSFTEDLHSMGQYIQQGKRILFETFLQLEDQAASIPIHQEDADIDCFGYLDNKDFAFLNDAAFKATVKAHHEGGVPGMIVNVPVLNEYYMGQLFYFFEYACFVSATILGVDPFDQPGVENYKSNMFEILRRSAND